MESDERERERVSGYNGKESKTSATAKYDEIKNTIRLVAADEVRERRGREDGERKRERSLDPWRNPAGPSPQGVSHVRGNTPSRKTNIGADK